MYYISDPSFKHLHQQWRLDGTAAFIFNCVQPHCAASTSNCCESRAVSETRGGGGSSGNVHSTSQPNAMILLLVVSEHRIVPLSLCCARVCRSADVAFIGCVHVTQAHADSRCAFDNSLTASLPRDMAIPLILTGTDLTFEHQGRDHKPATSVMCATIRGNQYEVIERMAWSS